jgi:hypothetical protein
MLIKQPFFIGGVHDFVDGVDVGVEKAKGSAFGAAAMFFLTFIACVLYTIQDTRRITSSVIHSLGSRTNSFLDVRPSYRDDSGNDDEVDYDGNLVNDEGHDYSNGRGGDLLRRRAPPSSTFGSFGGGGPEYGPVAAVFRDDPAAEPPLSAAFPVTGRQQFRNLSRQGSNVSTSSGNRQESGGFFT